MTIILGVKTQFETYHIDPSFVLFPKPSNIFKSGYGVVMRFRNGSYTGWIGIEMTSEGTGSCGYAITTYLNYPEASEWILIINPFT